jgi:hypothetical protein
MQIFANSYNELTGILFSRSGYGKRNSVFLIDLDPFFNGTAKLFIHLGLVVSVDATKHKSWASAKIALILFRPFHNF